MQTNPKNLSLFHDIEDRYHTELKRLKRKKFLLKAKLMLTIVLPLFVILLAVKTAKTFIRIKVRDLFAKPEKKSLEERKEETQPAPASIKSVEKEIIKPVPAGNRN